MNLLQSSLSILLTASWQASLLALLVLLLQFTTRRQLSARFRFALWFLVLIRFSALPLPESRLSLFNLFPSPTTSVATPTPPQPTITSLLPTIALESSPDTAVPSASHLVTLSASPLVTVPPSPRVTSAQIPAPSISKTSPAPVLPSPNHLVITTPTLLTSLYLAGAACIFLRCILSSLSLRRLLQSASPITDPDILWSLDTARRTLGIRRPIPLLATDQLTTPALAGLLRPRILIPQKLLSQFSPREFHLIFLHECAHLRRHDILLNYYLAFLAILHWFNPLFWIILPRIRADRELATDELVLLRTPDHTAFAATLLKLLDTNLPTRLPTGTVGIFETPTCFERRIHMIVAFRKTSAWLLVPSLALLAALAVPLLTTARSHAAKPLDNPTPTAHANGADTSRTIPTDTAESPADKKIRDQLEAPLKEISADNQSFEKVIQFLRDNSAIHNIDVNWSALQATGIDTNTPVTINLKEATLRKVLTLILDNASGNTHCLGYTVHDGVLTISTREDLISQTPHVVHVYNVRDLLQELPVPSNAGAPTTAPATAPSLLNPLCQLIENSASPETWRAAGGTIGSMWEFNNLITIDTLPDIHLQIADFLAKLRAADKENSPSLPVITAGPAASAADKKITEKLDANLKEITCEKIGLKKIIGFFSNSSGISNINVNWTALQNAGIGPETPVTVSLKNVTARKALTTILANIPCDEGHPGYVIEDGILNISTHDDLLTSAHRSILIYNVRDLLHDLPHNSNQASDISPTRDLCSLIKTTIAPETWRDAGGLVSNILEFKGLLAIETTPEIHAHIADLLTKLRTADKEIPAANIKPSIPTPSTP